MRPRRRVLNERNRIGGAGPRVPHDIAHLIVEDAFGLRSGLWGTLAAGGLV